jgi:pyruvate dehydrogenase E2 component (dihydrolipoamide acetyltransferase)
MTEGKIVAWLKKEGDPVRKGEPLLEIETDKANLEVEAEADGILRKVFHGAGETCPVLAVIGVIGGAGEEIDLDRVRAAAPGDAVEAEAPGEGGPPAVASPAAAGSTQAAAAGNGGRVLASPLARRVARERGVDIALLRGTGPGGRVLRRDVEAESPAGSHAPAAAPAAARLAPAPAAGKPYPPPSPRPPARVPLEGMRKAIASALQQSKQSIPHFYATASIDVTAAIDLKRRLEATGTKISLNDIVVRACAVALRDEPRVNCRVGADRIEYPANVNIGIAVGTDDGLVVPVVMQAESRDLAGTAAECRRVIESALAGKLIGSGQGTFTVSNLGMFGIESFTAIINPPEGAILAVGAALEQAVPYAGGFVPRSILRATLSSDHRAIDGILAARFLARLKHLLEHPEML